MTSSRFSGLWVQQFSVAAKGVYVSPEVPVAASSHLSTSIYAGLGPLGLVCYSETILPVCRLSCSVIFLRFRCKKSTKSHPE